jgi:hypothetical protein
MRRGAVERASDDNFFVAPVQQQRAAASFCVPPKSIAHAMRTREQHAMQLGSSFFCLLRCNDVSRARPACFFIIVVFFFISSIHSSVVHLTHASSHISVRAHAA